MPVAHNNDEIVLPVEATFNVSFPSMIYCAKGRENPTRGKEGGGTRGAEM